MYDLLAPDKNDWANDKFEGGRVSRIDSEKYRVFWRFQSKIMKRPCIFSSYFLKNNYYIIVNIAIFILLLLLKTRKQMQINTSLIKSNEQCFFFFNQWRKRASILLPNARIKYNITHQTYPPTITFLLMFD